MSPERAAGLIRTGLATHYLVIASSARPGTVRDICPTTSARSKEVRRDHPELVAGVYDREVTAEDIIQDLRILTHKRRD